MNLLLHISTAIDRFTAAIGRAVSWLILLAVLVSAANAISRKAFSLSSNASLELQWYLFGAAFLLAAAYTLQRDEHIRIDILSLRFSARTRNWIDVIGHAFVLIPFSAFMVLRMHPLLLDGVPLRRSFRQLWRTAALAGPSHHPCRLRPSPCPGDLRTDQAERHHRRISPRSAQQCRRRSRSRRIADDGARVLTAFVIQNMAPIMFAALVIALLIGYPVAFSLAFVGLAFGVLGISLGLFPSTFLHALPDRIFGVMATENLLAIPFFTLMGLILERSGMAEGLLDTAGKLFGPVRGGVAYAVVFVGALLAATTGVVAASVMAMGLISLPIMLRYGYDRRLASGVIAASGTLAQIIPPSLVLIVMADQLGRPVGDMYRGAIIPGLMLTGLYVAYVFLATLVSPRSAPALPAAGPQLWRERSLPRRDAGRCAAAGPHRLGHGHAVRYPPRHLPYPRFPAGGR